MGIAGLVDLKKRIKSIQNTKKLTKAMALVATSKLKKTRGSLERNNTYFESYNEVMSEIIPTINKESKYIKRNKGSKDKLIIVITSDLGMCGSYNFSLVNKVEELTSGNMDSSKIVVIGEKGKSLFKRYKFNLLDFDGKVSDIPSIDEAKVIFEYGYDMFEKGLVSEVILVYTWFKNPLVKQPVDKVMLPLQIKDEVEVQSKEEFDIEGNRDELMDALIPSYCNSMVYNALINAKTAEQSYRMETMNSASKNAGDLISSLEIKYNRIRQSAITQEISEIVGGSEAQG
ncbi:ATP synthase F1 subunit gamma [Clostridium culturomicium]|uniref:ATP synthase F1 subunit gamma n=1 Tax=Clostridium culturomicium TaxID=1499683 RepID=UPI00058B908C|nr:ATP synthase F1 subunit gamma [Clostridium culturomicium]